jgi:hypothetical protein
MKHFLEIDNEVLEIPIQRLDLLVEPILHLNYGHRSM